MTTVTVRQHTRRKPDRLERDPFRSEILARKEALERRVRKPDDWPAPKRYTRAEAERFKNSWLTRVMNVLAGRA